MLRDRYKRRHTMLCMNPAPANSLIQKLYNSSKLHANNDDNLPSLYDNKMVNSLKDLPNLSMKTPEKPKNKHSLYKSKTQTNVEIINKIFDRDTIDRLKSGRQSMPLADFDVTLYLSESIQNKRNDTNENYEKIRISPMTTISSPDFEQVFAQKMKLCSQICDFNSTNRHEIKMKTKLLNQILIFLSSTPELNKMPDASIEALTSMIYNNIHRKFPKVSKKDLYMDQFPPILEPAWEHISICYKILNKVHILIEKDPSKFKKIKKCCCHHNLKSPDPNERKEVVELILNNLKTRDQCAKQLRKYYKMLQKDDEIWKNNVYLMTSILMIFYEFFKIIGELDPLVETIFVNFIIPLIHHPLLSLFQEIYNKIVNRMIQAKSDYMETLIRHVVIYWPKVKCSKQTVCLNFLVHMIPRYMRTIHGRIKHFPLLFSRIIPLFAECSFSMNESVAEIALSIWKNDKFLFCLGKDKLRFYSIMIQSIKAASQFHWSSKIRSMADFALKVISKDYDIDPDIASKEANDQNSKKNWNIIVRIANSYDKSIDINNKFFQIRTIYNTRYQEENQFAILCKRL